MFYGRLSEISKLSSEIVADEAVLNFECRVCYSCISKRQQGLHKASSSYFR